MRHLVIFLALFVCSVDNLNSQVLSEEAMRYWYYRDRLKYFVYPGTEEGASLLMTSRNSNGATIADEPVGQYNGVEYGQTQRLNGYYIGLLATEYRLLLNNGQNADASKTLQELDLALDALIRIDKCEDLEPWNSTEYFDGFFIRNDVPPVLSTSMTDYLNEDLLTGDYWDYQDAYLERPGLPFSIESSVVLSHRKYTSSSNYYYINTPTTFDLSNYLAHGEKYWSYWKSDKFNSNDEIIGMYMGLALVAKYVDDQAVLEKAQEIAKRIRNYAIIHPSCIGLYGHDQNVSTGCIPFIMRYPDMDRILLDNGGWTHMFIYGIVGACSKINNNWSDPLVSLLGGLGIGSPYGFSISIKDAYGAGVYYYSTFNDESVSFNRPLYSTLIAISDRTGTWLSPQYAIRTIGNNFNHETFYLMLWADINDKDLSKNKYNFPFMLFMDQMQTAPCEGPYKYNSPYDFYSYGWGCEYKFGADIPGQYGAGDRTGVFPGADYMLFYNLACLAFPNGFETDDGSHYSFPYYINQNDRHMIGVYYPVVTPGFPFSSSTHEIGSQNNPEEIRAISTIVTNMVVANEALVFNSPTPDPSITGEVTLKAGESIRLTDGFRVDAGAHFLAKIESYSCNGLSYKNMNAPPWSENYRASFYDTLISVPRDQRAPIVYNDDDYGYEDYDELLWDDYYQYPDTGATPELPMSAYLNPNPCTSRTVLQIVPGSDVFVKIELYDMSGQKREELYEGNTGTSAFDLDIDMSAYSQGVYILRIIGNGAVKTIKLMKN